MGNKIAIWIIGITEILLTAALIVGAVFFYQKLTKIENAVSQVESDMESQRQERREKDFEGSDSAKNSEESTEETDGLFTADNDIYESEISAEDILDTYTEGAETYQLGSYTFYGYDNGRDLWKADFGPDHELDAFTGYVDTDSGKTLDVAGLAKKVGYEHDYYALGEEKFDADGHVLYEYVYSLNDDMEKEDPRYGYEYDYDAEGRRTEYRYYYNSYDEGLVLRSKSVYHYNEDGKQTGYEVYNDQGVLSKICKYKFNDKERRQTRVEKDEDGNVVDVAWYFYDLNGYTSKIITQDKVSIYLNDEDGNTILRVIYEKP